MKPRLLLGCVLVALSGCGHMGRDAAVFDEREIRQAERGIEAALSSPDPVAWVAHYTEDALFVFPGAPVVQGREALMRMARSMKPLSAVRIEDVKTEGSGRVAAVYGRGSWVSGAGTPSASTTRVRLLIVWRKGDDGRWRIAQELLQAEPPAR